YGDPVTTTINSGLTTAYFAKDFTVDLSTLSDNITIRLSRQDGMLRPMTFNMGSWKWSVRIWRSCNHNNQFRAYYSLFC
ncbi:hypothetical protein, partial [Chryseobacterium sp. CH1]|uniref:hypothetical protein n=1 Tax=Chryseobacterium sp. CH1 TaxID=713551 RepID=UPI001026D8DC